MVLLPFHLRYFYFLFFWKLYRDRSNYWYLILFRRYTGKIRRNVILYLRINKHSRCKSDPLGPTVPRNATRCWIIKTLITLSFAKQIQKKRYRAFWNRNRVLILSNNLPTARNHRMLENDLYIFFLIFYTTLPSTEVSIKFRCSLTIIKMIK